MRFTVSTSEADFYVKVKISKCAKIAIQSLLNHLLKLWYDNDAEIVGNEVLVDWKAYFYSENI